MLASGRAARSRFLHHASRCGIRPRDRANASSESPLRSQSARTRRASASVHWRGRDAAEGRFAMPRASRAVKSAAAPRRGYRHQTVGRSPPRGDQGYSTLAGAHVGCGIGATRDPRERVEPGRDRDTLLQQDRPAREGALRGRLEHHPESRARVGFCPLAGSRCGGRAFRHAPSLARRQVGRGTPPRLSAPNGRTVCLLDGPSAERACWRALGARRADADRPAAGGARSASGSRAGGGGASRENLARSARRASAGSFGGKESARVGRTVTHLRSPRGILGTRCGCRVVDDLERQTGQCSCPCDCREHCGGRVALARRAVGRVVGRDRATKEVEMKTTYSDD